METVVRTDLYKHTHAADVTAHPELFRLRKISHEEKLENLCIFLEDIDHIASGDIAVNLPPNEDALAALNVIANNQPTEPLNCPTQWGLMCNSLATRLVSRITDIEGDTLIVVHLERTNKSNKYDNILKLKIHMTYN